MRLQRYRMTRPKTRTELVFIGTKLALEVKYPRQGGGFKPAFIKDANKSMDVTELQDNVNEFLAISDRQAIITIKGVDMDRTRILIDKVTILLKDCAHFGQDI